MVSFFLLLICRDPYPFCFFIQAYKHLDDDRGRRYELGQSAVAGMRGVLLAWMRQSEQLEEWKNHQNTKLALHSVVDLNSGANLLDSSKYNHLQLDIVCLYLLFLVQMITSGQSCNE